MNLVVLTGRLTKEPEIKSGNGKSYCKFGLAVNNPFKKDEADFINCSAFGKTAESIVEYLDRGSKLGVEGRLQMNKYEVNGEKRISYEVMVNSVEFLDSKGKTETKDREKANSESDDEFPF